MDVVLKGRGTRITDHLRSAAVRKLSRLARMQPRVVRVELEVITERNPKLGGIKRVEAAVATPRRTFRAHAESSDVDSAIDQVAEKLERQLRDDNTKRRTKLITGAGRLGSVKAGPGAGGSEE